MNNLTKRAITGISLVLVISVGIEFSYLSFILMMFAINLLSLSEFYKLFSTESILPRKRMGTVLSIGFFLCFLLYFLGILGWEILLVNIPLAFAILTAELYLKAINPFLNLAITFLGIFLITVPVCLFTGLAFLPIHSADYHPEIVLGSFFILWVNDSGAYFVGKYFGRHHLFERISPHKTWEGSAGGAACAALVTYVNAHLFTSLDYRHWVNMAIIIIIAGTFGDLIKSLMKRSLNLKDSGNLLPGHGGMLDRFDTLLGSAPFLFCYLILFGYA